MQRRLLRIERQRATRLLIIAADDDVLLSAERKRAASHQHTAGSQRIGGGRHQRSSLDDRATAVAVLTAERQRAAAGFDETPCPGNIVRPAVRGIKTARGGIHRHLDIAVKRAITTGGGNEIDPAPAIAVIEQRITSLDAGGKQHRAALCGIEIGKSCFQQNLGPLRHHHRCIACRLVATEGKGHAPAIIRAVLRRIGKAVDVRLCTMGKIDEGLALWQACGEIGLHGVMRSLLHLGIFRVL